MNQTNNTPLTEKTTLEKVREIKQSFRLYMNGVTAESLKNKGAIYKISWGMSLQHLQEMAAEYGKDYDLAIELWKSEVRECRLLATMTMPAERMSPELLDVWMERVHTQELAEMLCYNLLQYLDFAPDMAFRWMASDKTLLQIAAYNLLSRLFANGERPDANAINEYLDQAITALKSNDKALQHAAMNSIIRFADLGSDYELIAIKATKAEGYDFL